MYHVFVGAAPFNDGVITGLLASRFTVTDFVAERPAALTATQVNVSPAVLELTVELLQPVALATPDSSSEVVHVTTAFVVYQ